MLPLLVPHSTLHFTATSATTGVADGDAIQVGASSGRPLTMSLPTRAAQTVLTHDGDTIATLASSFHADRSALRWANAILDGTDLNPGTSILVPPGAGALAPVEHNERPSHFAQRLGLDARVVLDYNALRRDVPRPDGTFLQIPVEAAPSGSLASSSVVPIATGVPGVPSSELWDNRTSSAGGRFPWGQCTWYVSAKRIVTWTGNAGTWFRNAQAAGRPEGRVPVVGAIAVIATNWVGHVAYVEKLNPNGSFVVSEMHYPGLGTRDERTVTAGTIDLVGFIY